MIIITQKIQVCIKSTTSRKKKQTASDCDRTVDSQASTSIHQNVSYAYKNDNYYINYSYY